MKIPILLITTLASAAFADSPLSQGSKVTVLNGHASVHWPKPFPSTGYKIVVIPATPFRIVEKSATNCVLKLESRTPQNKLTVIGQGRK
jgi:hypothetical protein